MQLKNTFVQFLLKQILNGIKCINSKIQKIKKLPVEKSKCDIVINSKLE